eukprot:11162450-Lingulodinium_polyedra.AAC.1
MLSRAPRRVALPRAVFARPGRAPAKDLRKRTRGATLPAVKTATSCSRARPIDGRAWPICCD